MTDLAYLIVLLLPLILVVALGGLWLLNRLATPRGCNVPESYRPGDDLLSARERMARHRNVR